MGACGAALGSGQSTRSVCLGVRGLGGHPARSPGNASDNSQRFRETCFAFALTPQQVQQISSSIIITPPSLPLQQQQFQMIKTSCTRLENIWLLYQYFQKALAWILPSTAYPLRHPP
ncbi:PIAS1 [Cervus elaphus hippelaphus]|uniref:PIAS1 n=1 Tax=Cervus elaphus hippelaphus TaxID=46360 RepID=A0A212CTS7_CEREH|nr:PIAS1 [Cervus elaphus hippelaphus]